MTHKGRFITADQVKLLIHEGEGLAVEFKERYTLRIRNPVKHLDHAKREVVAARYYDTPAEAVENAALLGEATG